MIYVRVRVGVGVGVYCLGCYKPTSIPHLIYYPFIQVCAS